MSPRLSDLFLSTQSDERLIALAAQGHHRAFSAIVSRYQSELLRLARRVSADVPAEDVVQQAFLNAFGALRAGTEVRQLRGWLYQIVRHVAHRQRTPAALPIDETVLGGEPLEDVVQRRSAALSALTAIGNLPDRQRQALVGAALQGLGRAELAESMGVSEGAIRQLLHRARTSLRTVVTALTPYPLARFTAESAMTGGAAETAVPAATAVGGGLAVKLGAVASTGLIATSLVTVHLFGGHPGASHGHPSADPSPRRATVAAVGSGRSRAAAPAPAPAPATRGKSGPATAGGRVVFVSAPTSSARHRPASASAARPSSQPQPASQTHPSSGHGSGDGGETTSSGAPGRGSGVTGGSSGAGGNDSVGIPSSEGTDTTVVTDDASGGSSGSSRTASSAGGSPGSSSGGSGPGSDSPSGSDSSSGSSAPSSGGDGNIAPAAPPRTEN